MVFYLYHSFIGCGDSSFILLDFDLFSAYFWLAAMLVPGFSFSYEKPVKMKLLYREIIMIFDRDHISSIIIWPFVVDEMSELYAVVLDDVFNLRYFT